MTSHADIPSSSGEDREYPDGTFRPAMDLRGPFATFELPAPRTRPVRVHVRTGSQEDGQSTYAISVPRQFAEDMGDGHYLPELLPGGTLVFRPVVPVVEPTVTDEMVERVAQALYEAVPGELRWHQVKHQDYAENYRRDARAALSAAFSTSYPTGEGS